MTTLFRAAAVASIATALLAPFGTAGAQQIIRPPQGPGVPDNVLKSETDNLATRLAAQNKFSGVVLLARNGVPLYEKAFGPADREKRRPNTVGTAFNVSSIGKMITQTAIAQLVTAGKINIDSTISTYWPDYPNADIAHRVTLRQLLEHRSGIGGSIFQNLTSLRRNQDYLKNFVSRPLEFEPGSRFAYSNAGYVILGEIVSRVSGEDYHQYVRAHILQPTGMTHTDFYSLDSLPPNAALGYTREETTEGDGKPIDPVAPLRVNTNIQPVRGSAAGGIYSTTGDLLRFVQARRTGRLPVLPIGGGIRIGNPPPGAQFSPMETIAGGSAGSNGIVSVGPADGVDVIILANLDPPAAGDVLDPIRSIIAGGGGPGQVGPGAHPAEGPVTTAAELPATPAGRAAAAYLSAFNTGDGEAMRKVIEELAVTDPSRPTQSRVDGYLKLFGDWGPLKVSGAEWSSPDKVTVKTMSDKSGPLSLIVEVHPGNRFSVLFDFRPGR